jgi:hypothetical protein
MLGPSRVRRLIASRQRGREPEGDLGKHHDQEHGGELHQHERAQRPVDRLERDLGRGDAFQVEGGRVEEW